MTQTAMQTAATARRTISEPAPFCPFAHTKGKGGMRLEPDRFHTWGLAVPGGVHRAGSSRGVFAAQADKAGYPAHFVRDGGGYHAGGQCVEPAAAGHCTVAGQGGVGTPGAGAYFRRCGTFAAGGCRRAAAGGRPRALWAYGAGGHPAQSAGGHGGGAGCGAGAARGRGCRKRRAGAELGHRLAEHPGGSGGQSAADPERAHPGAVLCRRGGVRAGGASGRGAGLCAGRVGRCSAAVAYERGGGLHGVCDRTGDDP